ncbi:MAG: cyclic nucleotide-binding domain-containing protein [Bdellovibrionaceae bacterium]|nr:cyclic nucleotide-binding domain-containing protein [Pseudobdellovibrionaceae bacterium]
MPEILKTQVVGESIVVRKPHDLHFRKLFPLAWKPLIDAYQKGLPPSRVLQDGIEKSSPVRLRDWIEFVREVEGKVPGDAGLLRKLREFDVAPGWFEYRLFELKLWSERNVWARFYPGFYFLGFLTMALAGLRVLSGFDLRHFLWVNGSFELAFVGLFLGLSLLGLTKGVVLVAMHLLATGSWPETRIAFRGLMIDLDVDASPVEAHRLKSVKLFYFTTSALLYLAGAAFWGAFSLPGLNAASLSVLGLLMTFLSLNPRRRGEVSKIFGILYPQWKVRRALSYLENRALFAFFKRGRWIQDESQLLRYALLCLLWSAGFLAFLIGLVVANGQDLWLALGHTRGSAWGSVILMLLIFAGITATVVSELWRLLARHFLFLFQRPLRDFSRNRSIRTERRFDPAQIRRFLSASPLFHGAAEASLDAFLECGVIQIVKPGQSLIVQGNVGTELFVLLEGEAVVRRLDEAGEAQDLAVLSKGAVFGEMSLLRNTVRTASVVALSPLRVFMMPNSEFARIFQGENIRMIERRIALSGVLGDSSVFQDLPAETLQIILSYGEFREFKKGELLIEHGDRDKDFYIVLRGEVEAVRAGDMRLNVIGPAGFFGEVSLFENRPRSASIRALADGVALKLPFDGFWRMVDQNPALAAHIQELSWLRRETPDNLADSRL